MELEDEAKEELADQLSLVRHFELFRERVVLPIRPVHAARVRISEVSTQADS